MIWQVLARKKDGEEVRVPATTLSEARGAACCFIRDGLDVVKIESESGFIIEPHGPFAIASRAGWPSMARLYPGNELSRSGRPSSEPLAWTGEALPIVRVGLAAGAIVAAASIGVLLMHPAAQQTVLGGPLASEAAVSAGAEALSSTAAAARISATVEAALPAPALPAASAEPVPAAVPVPGASAEPAPAALSALAPTAASAEPVPAALPAPAPASAEPAPAALPAPAPTARSAEPVRAALPVPVPTAGSAEPVPAAVLVPALAAASAEPVLAAVPAEPVPAAVPARASPTQDAPPAVAVPASKAPLGRPRLATAEIAALRARGDSLLGVGDITSARLFYERASDAGDGRAALRLGATYDPGFLDRVHLPHQHGDVAQALSWYRRARDLGETEAERWIQGLETKSGQ